MKTLTSAQPKAGSIAAQVLAAITSVELPVGEGPLNVYYVLCSPPTTSIWKFRHFKLSVTFAKQL